MTRAERRREERLRKKGFENYEDALAKGVINHRIKTGCLCLGSIGVQTSENELSLICLSCSKKFGSLELASVQEEDYEPHGL